MAISFGALRSLGWRSLDKVDPDQQLEDLALDSRDIQPGWGFIAADGMTRKGIEFIPAAIELGASAVFIDNRYADEVKEFLSSVAIFTSEDFGNDKLRLITTVYDNPSKQLYMIGITGTNGKTSIAYGIYRVAGLLGNRSSYTGTIGSFIDGKQFESRFTSLPIDQFYRFLAKVRSERVSLSAVEASSHGLDQGRLEGVYWNTAIFTNLTPDHRDYHKTMEKYYQAKQILFDQIVTQKVEGKPRNIIINTDDLYGERLFYELNDRINADFDQKEVRLFGIGQKGTGGVTICNVEKRWEHYAADIILEGKTYRLKIPTIGLFNIYNYAMVFLALLFAGHRSDEILDQLAVLKGAPGRMEPVRKDGRLVIVDYAHTPDALENALITIKELQPESVSVVFGCGGDRDNEKRPQMGEVAIKNADSVILTNDNPRSEPPEQIVEQICGGIRDRGKVEVIYDRKDAIARAISSQKKGGVVLVAGKGHEDYQIIGDQKKYFSDIETVKAILEEQCGP